MHIFFIIFIYLLISISISIGGTHNNAEYANNLIKKDERRFPNGTVVGTYTYKDKDSNTVHVKYFADDSSYGVELRSSKILKLHNDQSKASKIENAMMSSDLNAPTDALSAAFKLLGKEYKNDSYNPFEILSGDEYPKKNNEGNYKSNDEYEVFYQNEFKPLDKYDKQKVRVYVDQNKRKSRNAIHRQKPYKNCNRF